MKKLLAFILAFALSASASQITGTIQNPDGTAVANGTITFLLSQPAVLTNASATVATNSVSCYTDASGSVVGLPNPLPPPVGSNAGGGSLTPGNTYFLKITYWNASGETLPSPELAFVIGGGSSAILVTAPTLQPGNATGYKIYASTTTGTETLQTTVTGFGNSTLTSIAAGAALPVTNPTQCLIAGNDSMIPSSAYYNVNVLDSQSSQVSGFPQRYYIQGTPVNLAQLLPLASTIARFPQPIVMQPNANALQTINGALTITGAFNALVVNGPVNLSPCDVDATTFGTSDIIVSVLAAMNSSACALNGGRIRIPPNPAGGCWVSTTQLLIPNSGGTAPRQKTFLLQGAGAGGLEEGHGTTNGPNGGTCIDMRFNAATCGKICTLGQGTLTSLDIGWKDTATDGSPFVYTTNTSLQFHRNQFYGNCSDNPMQDVFILGGTSNAYAGTAADPFQGYGTNIDSNTADCIRRFALIQTFGNSINITNNHIFIFSVFSTGGAIEINPTSGVAEGNVITGNLIEVLGYKYGINLVQNARFNTIIGNSCFDKGGGTTACVNSAAASGNNGNTIIDGNVDPTMASINGNTSSLGVSSQNNACIVHSPTVAGVDHCMLKRDTSNYTQLDVDGDGTKIFSGLNFFEVTAPPALAQFDVCYADSTAHAIFCSFNGGSFIRMSVASANAIIAWGCNGTATASQTLFLDAPGAANYACTNTGGTVQQEVLPSAGTIQNLRVRCQVAGKVAGSGVFTVRKTGGDTTSTCTIGTGTTCSDTTHSFTVVAGDFLDVKYTTQAAETLANCSVTVEKQ